MFRKLLHLTIVPGLFWVGCAQTSLLKTGVSKTGKETASFEVSRELVRKYKDKLILNNDGVHFFHSLECSGAVSNRFQNQTLDPKTQKLTGYKQMIKCRPTRETHTIIISRVKYNRKGYKVSYDNILTCNKTGENYSIKIKDIKSDYSGEAVSYTAEVNGDTLKFPMPREKKKKN
ncbi:MAG: hypothetical protein ACE5GM_05120 [bacterium]